MKLHYIAFGLLGLFGGAFMGSQILLSINLLALIKHGYYMADDIFYAGLLSLLTGVPIGGIAGTGLSICLVRRGVKFSKLAIIFSIGILLSFFLSNYFDEKIRPSLVKAAQLNDLAFVQTAIRHNANLNVKDMNGRTALTESIFWKHPDIAKYLIQAGADPNVKEEDGGGTALISAVDSGFADIVKLLIKAGADVNAKTNQGWTALMEAVYRGKLDTVKVLIQAGADVNAKTDNGSTPLSLAIQAGYVDIVHILDRAGAKK